MAPVLHPFYPVWSKGKDHAFVPIYCLLCVWYIIFISASCSTASPISARDPTRPACRLHLLARSSPTEIHAFYAFLHL